MWVAESMVAWPSDFLMPLNGEKSDAERRQKVQGTQTDNQGVNRRFPRVVPLRRTMRKMPIIKPPQQK